MGPTRAEDFIHEATRNNTKGHEHSWGFFVPFRVASWIHLSSLRISPALAVTRMLLESARAGEDDDESLPFKDAGARGRATA